MRQKHLDKNMILLLSGKFVSMFGSEIFSFALGLYILTATGSAMSYGLSLLVDALPRVLLAPFAGTVVDKLSRKKIIVCTDILSGIVVLTLLLMSGGQAPGIGYVYVSMFLLSVLNVFFSVAVEASIPSLVSEGSLGRVYSVSQMISSSALILAPIIAGIINGFVDIKVFILIDAVSFLLSAASESFMVFRDISVQESGAEKTGTLTSMKEGFNYLQQNRKALRLVVFCVLLNFFFAFGYSVPLPHIAVNVLKLSAVQYGYIQSASSAGALCASLLFATLCKKIDFNKLYIWFIRWIAVAICMIGVLTLPAGLISKGVLAAVLMVISVTFGFSIITGNIPVSVQLQEATDDAFRGRVQGLDQGASAAMTPVAMLLSGICLDRIAPALVCGASGIGMLIYTVWFMRKMKE